MMTRRLMLATGVIAITLSIACGVGAYFEDYRISPLEWRCTQPPNADVKDCTQFTKATRD